MGPYNEYTQQKRAERISSVSLNYNGADSQRILHLPLVNLANNETGYNSRVV